MPRRRTSPPVRRTAGIEPGSGLPSLEILEQFSVASLARWLSAGRKLERLGHALFFGLERHRAAQAAALTEAIRSQLTGPLQFRGWARIVDYRYSMDPLSVAGSIRRDGGRFNIGAAIDPSAYTPFPALYVAEDLETAFRERFGIERTANVGGLSAEELVLRRTRSFTNVELDLTIDLVFDVGSLQSLAPCAAVLGKFKMPREVQAAARALSVRQPWLVRSASGLQTQLLSKDWRLAPAQYDLPSNSQIFGRLCVGAGAHAILYPSARNSARRCLALYPQNWRGSASYVEVAGAVPDGILLRRLDGVTTTSSN